MNDQMGREPWSTTKPWKYKVVSDMSREKQHPQEEGHSNTTVSAYSNDDLRFPQKYLWQFTQVTAYWEKKIPRYS